MRTTSPSPSAAPLGLAENIAKDIPENIVDVAVLKSAKAPLAPGTLPQPGVAELVVGAALIGV